MVYSIYPLLKINLYKSPVFQEVMFFEHEKLGLKIGEKVGFLGGYLIFTSLFFFILSYFHKLPLGWTYFHLLGITAPITILGLVVKRYLE